MSMEILPKTFARFPFTRKFPMLESARGYPCQYPTGQTAEIVRSGTISVKSYPTRLPAGNSLISLTIVFHVNAGFRIMRFENAYSASSDGQSPYIPIPMRAMPKCASGKTTVPSVAAAYGTVVFPEAHFDMVRIGI